MGTIIPTLQLHWENLSEIINTKYLISNKNLLVNLCEILKFTEAFLSQTGHAKVEQMLVSISKSEVLTSYCPVISVELHFCSKSSQTKTNIIKTDQWNEILSIPKHLLTDFFLILNVSKEEMKGGKSFAIWKHHENSGHYWSYSMPVWDTWI